MILAICLRCRMQLLKNTSDRFILFHAGGLTCLQHLGFHQGWMTVSFTSFACKSIRHSFACKSIRQKPASKFL